MKKLKTGILIKDKVYIRRLQKAIHTEYDQDIECIVFEDIENVCREAKRKQLDLVLIDETILVAYEKLSRFCAIAIVSGTRRYDRSNDYGVIYKFQHVDDLVANMVQIYEEHHGNARIIAFTGACGNCGTSVLAAACAKAIAAKKKKVLYIDGETATSESDYLKEADALGIACGKEIGIHNLYEEKAYARFRELLDEVKYDFIVMDVQNAMLQYRDFASLVQELVIVESREGRAQLRATKLKQMLQELAQEFDLTKIDAVGVSQKPRPVEGSYMPCFLAGVSAATAFAAARDIPLIHTTHQQGHAAAALYAAKGEALFSQKVLLFHISGGTTDLLLCDQVRAITTLGTSTDLYAGQAVDRVGVRLGFGFPAGAEVSRLAAQCAEDIRPKSSVKGLQCSLSGLENQCNALLAAGKAPEYVCKYCLLCVADTVVRMTKAAQKEYPGLPVVCAGGVMSSDIIRTWVQQRLPQVYFVPGQYSSDNAIGVSILAAREAGLWLM